MLAKARVYIIPGSYGLPVPPDSLKLGGSSLFQQDSRAGSDSNSGRNSPVAARTLAEEAQVRELEDSNKSVSNSV